MPEDFNGIGKVDAMFSHVLPVLLLIPFELHGDSVYTLRSYVKGFFCDANASPQHFAESAAFSKYVAGGCWTRTFSSALWFQVPSQWPH